MVVLGLVPLGMKLLLHGLGLGTDLVPLVVDGAYGTCQLVDAVGQLLDLLL